MKTTKRVFSFRTILSKLPIGSLFTSCSKQGCTNPATVNYDAKATEDDGFCINVNSG